MAARGSRSLSRSLWRQAVDRISGWLRGVSSGIQAGVYAGSTMSRLIQWAMGPLSADQATRGDLRGLRDAARELERDNPWARRYVELCSENVVGPDGFQLQGQVGASRGELNEDVNALLEAAWVDFARPEHCSVDGRLGLTAIERQAIERWQGADGEYLLQIVLGRGKYGVQLQPIDPDLLDETLHRDAAPGVNEIRQGVEIDAFGRPVNYWVWTSYPGEQRGRKRERKKIPADQVIHLYEQTRPGQTRGVTRFAPVVIPLEHLDGMQEAVLVQQRIAAAQMAFLKPNERYAGPVTPAKGEERIRMEAEPGMLVQIPDGFDVETWNTGQPGPNYDAFAKNVLRAIAAGLGVSYMSLTGDLNGTSYSSARVGLLDERRHWRRVQETLREQLHEKLFPIWVRQAVLAGPLREARLRVRDIAELSEVVWLMPGWAWVDPTKDVDTALAEVDAGLNSLTNVAAQNGRNLESILRQRQREIQMAARMNVPINLSRRGGAPGTSGQNGAAPGASAEDPEASVSDGVVTADATPPDSLPGAAPVRLIRG